LVARNSVPPMPQIANMARTRTTKKRKGAPAPPPSPNTKRARTKIVEGLARQKLLGAKTRKDAYGNLTKIVKEGRKVYPWLTYGQLKAKVAHLKKTAATNLTDITNRGTVAPSSIIPPMQVGTPEAHASPKLPWKGRNKRLCMELQRRSMSSEMR
jgi:hypothetical protein